MEQKILTILLVAIIVFSVVSIFYMAKAKINFYKEDKAQDYVYENPSNVGLTILKTNENSFENE